MHVQDALLQEEPFQLDDGNLTSSKNKPLGHEMRALSQNVIMSDRLRSRH